MKRLSPSMARMPMGLGIESSLPLYIGIGYRLIIFVV
jgi:hypothetical protein